MEWKVRYIDYPLQYQKMKSEILSTIDDVLSHGDVMLRRQLSDFEANLAKFVGTKYAVGLSNCTDAMHLTLRAAGIGPGDEVITVSHTFVATAAAIHHAGAKPVLIDIGEDHNMNVDLVEAAITPRTKAIVPVHLNGRLCDMENLLAIANKNSIFVIEDAAQALGASLNRTKGGAFALGGCFSFYPAKKAVDLCRKDNGPAFIECATYRLRGHVGPDDNIQGTRTDIRPEEEIREWRKKDPLINFQNFLLKNSVLKEQDLEGIKREVEREVEEAHLFAKNSSYPKESELTKYVYKR